MVVMFLSRARRRPAWTLPVARPSPLWLLLLAMLMPPATRAADVVECRKLFIAGEYTNVITLAEKAFAADERDEEWPLMLTQTLLTLGRLTDAQATLAKALSLYPSSVRLRLLGHEVLRQNGDPAAARGQLEEIASLARSSEWRYRDPANRVALGEAVLLLGVDPRLALDVFFDPVKKSDPDFRGSYLASGNLALAKNDFQLAGKIFAEALKRFPEDPDLHFGLAQSFAPSDPARMADALDLTLEYNTNHAGARLLLADHQVDAEDYDGAEETLAEVLALNPVHPEALAYRAVLANLRGNAKAEKKFRAAALKFWPTNPKVDHLIGRKLSQKYRFTEGAACQRQALRFDAGFVPAKIQLAEDLLRLGEEEEGWQLAEEVHRLDAYDVVAYNLITLKDSIAHFQTLTDRDFILRMDPREAAIYGSRALDLLARARTNLSAKYGLQLTRPTTVEIFPQQKDFAIRTFGLPGGAGYLGVCFGSVITANSPASQAAHPVNWQAVLWHEFCHVITLQLTRNKMPRWLSEGISVYEERQANPAWGEHLTPRYREMILGDDLTPVSKLSAAFLSPKSALHLQFAYYESSLVVEFLIERYGLESLQKILRDLGAGLPINEAIEKHTAPMAKIDEAFAALAVERAEQLAPGLDWEKPSRADLSAKNAGPAEVGKSLKLLLDPTDEAAGHDGPDPWLAWGEKHPTNFYVLTHQAGALIAGKKWEEAKAPLQKLIELYPGNSEGDNAYTLLAAAHRALNETNEERQVLARLAALSADATDAYARLMELGAAAQDWPAVAENASRFLAVNPLLPQSHRLLAQAEEALGNPQPAAEAYRTLLRLDVPDPAEVHFRLAKLLHQTGDAGAKRHVLQALEEAPRYREAHRLLLQIEQENALPRDPGDAPEINAEKKP